MLTMSNQFEMYHRHQQQQQQRHSVSDPTMLSHSDSIQIRGSLSTSCGSGGDSPSAPGKESIHSGQFMVSHFEAEEAQDDDDTEIKILDLEDPQLAKPDEVNACTEVQLYVPLKVREYGSMTTITSHLEIETSLTKLFKCMNLAYSQKLTSPKWNHFKGIRLRWKDKIRLNNVIWRCWHMQFILKKRTPVCQFASPLDVDIHSNPQSVVLEGKYWKRQLTVIQAEYRKWRRNFKSNISGCLIYDTKSEFDFFECSPLSSDKNLMLIDDWTTDTLFSAINGPFPFPDPREIARGAGNADFIQPSLGPLQPNLDDIGITFDAFIELLQNPRLPPVPEEVGDDMLKNVDYGFPAIMGANQDDSTSIMDVTNQNQSMPNGGDANMIELNTPFKVMTFAEVEESFRDDQSSSLLGSQSDLNNSMMMSGNQSSDSEFNSSPKRPSIKTFPISMDSPGSQMSGFLGKSVIKGRVSKSLQRPFRREPHNYDKAQPTLHQTEIYQQMLAERQQQQQQQQQHMQQQALALQLQAHANSSQSHQSSMQLSPQFPSTMLPTNTNNNNNSNNSFNMLPPPQNILNIPTNPNIKAYSIATKNNLLPNVKIEPPTQNNNVLPMFSMNNNTSNDTGFHHHSTGLSNLRQMTPSGTSNSTPSFKPYPNVQTFQKSASTGNYINVRAAIAGGSIQTMNSMSQENTHLQQAQAQQSHGQQQQQHSQSLPQPLHQHTLLLSTPPTPTPASSSQPQQQQQILPKEMFRSNSLPLNSSLQKLEARIEHFAVPKYQAKSNKSRSRSNSVQQQNAPTMIGAVPPSGQTLQIPQLQNATSDPILNSTLAQLLTAPSLPPPTPNTLTANNNYVSSGNVSQQQQQQHQKHQQHAATHQSMQSAPKAVSPKKSTSLPVPAPTLMMHSPPGNKMMSFPPPSSSHIPSSNVSLSPDSFHDQDSPLSPSHNIKYPRETQRRAGHIHAEQKRRYNIKNGFDMLHSLIPQLQQNPNAKLSKAAMLQKGAEYIKQLRSDRNVLKDKMDLLRKERDNLNSSLTHLHSILPANGAPVTRQRTEHVRQLYEHYVRCRAMQNWKFWILGLILEPLLSSYTTSVSSASADELRRTIFLWVDQHCSLVDLRPAVSNKLRYLSTTTDILSDPPSTLQEEVIKAINNTPGQHPNLNGS